MKKSFFAFVLAMLCGGMVLCVSLTSCENYMKGSDASDQLRELIEIANSNPVTYYVVADKGSGTLSTGQLRLKRKETFDLMFTPSAEWKFLGWEVIDRDSGKIVTDSIKFDDPTKLEVRGTVISPRENLTIHPKCLLMPAVISVSPASDIPQLANIPIEIKFNQPMEAENTSKNDSIFNYDNISITYNGKHIEDKFEIPYFDNTKKILTIKPKVSELKAFIAPLESKKLHIVLSENIFVSIENNVLYLSTNNSSFDITYKKESDEQGPTIDDFFVTRFDGKTIKEEQKFLPKALSDFANSEYEKNRAKDIVYIHGICHDDGSGIKKITVTEQRTNDKNGDEVISAKTNPLEFYPEDQKNSFIETNGNVEFLIEYNLVSEAGAILLETKIFDACDNCTTEQIVVIRNTVDNFTPWFAVYNAGHLQTNPDSISDLSNIKTLRIASKESDEQYQYDELYEYIYKTTRLASNNITVECQYKDDDGVIQTDSFIYYQNQNEWLYTLKNVDSVTGLEITVFISDDLGNSFSNVFSFPSVPVPILVTDTASQREVKFYVEPTVYYINEVNNYVSWVDNVNKAIFTPTSGSYKFFAQNGSLIGEISPSYSYSSFNNIQSSLDEVKLISNTADFNKCNDYYNNQAATEIIIRIDEDSWDKYDSIFLKTSENKIVILENSKTEFRFLETTTNCFTNSYTFKVYGIKGNKMTSGTPGTIPKLTDSKYDNCPPEISFTRKDYYTYNLTVTDIGSSPASVLLITKTGEQIELANNETGFENVSIPSWLVEEEALHKSYNVAQIKVIDTQFNSNIVDNTLSSDWESDTYGEICGIVPSSSQWNIKFDRKLWIARKYNFYIYEWNNSSKSWSVPKKYYDQHPSADNNDFIGPYPITSNRFIKIITTPSEGDSSDSTFDKQVHTPQYFYTSTSTNGLEENKFIIPIDSESLYVASDVPVLIHTVATKKTYDECHLWTASEWERFHLQAGEKVFSFSPEDRYQKKYIIPVNEVRGAGCECYVVIAYFADGSTKMSDVMVVE